MIKINNEIGFRDIVVIGTLIGSMAAAWFGLPAKIMVQAEEKFYSKALGVRLENDYKSDVKEIKDKIEYLVRIHINRTGR